MAKNNLYYSYEFQNKLSVANKSKQLFTDTLDLLADNVKEIYNTYILPYQEQKSNCTREGEIITECHTLTSELGVVDYLPKKDIYPSWIYNFMDLLSLINPSGKNDLLNLILHTEKNHIPYHWCRDNYILSMLGGNYLFTGVVDSVDNKHSYSQVSQFKESEKAIENLSSQRISRASKLVLNVGSVGNILYTTQTGIPMDCISPGNKTAFLQLPCKDEVCQLVSDLLQAEPCFGLRMDGTSLMELSDTALYEYQTSKRYLIGYLQQTEYTPNYKCQPLYPCKVHAETLTPETLSYTLDGFEGFHIPYLIQRGDCLNSGVQVCINGILDKTLSQESYVKSLYQTDGSAFLPIGIPEPIYMLIRVKYNQPNEGDYIKKLDSKFVSLRGDINGYYYLFDIRKNTYTPLYIDYINKYAFSTYAYLLPPLFVWAYYLIKDHPDSIPTFDTIQEIYNSNYYHNAVVDILTTQSQFITACNEYIDSYNKEIKKGDHYPVKVSNIVSDREYSESYQKNVPQLDKYHLMKTNIDVNLSAEQPEGGVEYISSYIKAQNNDVDRIEEYKQYLKNNYQCELDYEEIMKSYD